MPHLIIHYLLQAGCFRYWLPFLDQILIVYFSKS